MSFAELVIFVDGVGYSLAARSRDEMFIKKQCILWNGNSMRKTRASWWILQVGYIVRLRAFQYNRVKGYIRSLSFEHIGGTDKIHFQAFGRFIQ